MSSIRYADLSQNPQTDVTFEWNKILSLENGAVLMYSYARAKSIQRKGGVSTLSEQITDGVEDWHY